MRARNQMRRCCRVMVLLQLLGLRVQTQVSFRLLCPPLNWRRLLATQKRRKLAWEAELDKMKDASRVRVEISRERESGPKERKKQRKKAGKKERTPKQQT